MQNKFQVFSDKIEVNLLKNNLLNSEVGAYVSFEGLVRNHNDGKEVLQLEYEIYEKMSIKEAEKILIEAKKNFDLVDFLCVHRKGLLQIGDIAVYVGVTAFHRGAAFQACEYIINQIKVRLPIWKKEYYVNGSAEWVNCQECLKHSPL